ncbi:MAG TPA: universal stress protein [Syntrophorhabdaceae bacterium]|nr:universal stress protein [Syntrophorhabdaceae bacterium]
MVKPTKILVPVDFSDSSAKALRRAVDVARESGAELVLLHVVDPYFQTCTVDYCLKEEEVDQMQRGMLNGARTRLEQEMKSIPGGIKVSTEVREGLPYEEILKFQDQAKVDLIVIAPHGKSAIKKFFLGSVSSSVLKGAKCEVLLVR